MKKIYLLIILLLSGLGYAQGIGSYNVSFGITNINVKVIISGNCGSYLDSWLIFANSGEVSFFHQPIGDYQDFPRNWSSTFLSSQKLTGIKCYSEGRKWHGGFNSGCKNDNSSTELKNVSYGITEYYLSDYFTRLYNFRATLKILPKLHIQEIEPSNLDNILPKEEKITIKSDTGFLSTEYNWQYSIDGTTWIDMPQFNGMSELNVDARTILGNNVNNYLNQNIFIRQKAYDVFSNTVSYVIKRYSKATLDGLANSSFMPEPGKYIVSGWVKENVAQQQITYSESNITIAIANNNAAPFYSETFKPSGAIIDGWQRILGIIEIPTTNPQDKPVLQIGLNCTSPTADCYFDDMRFFPYNGNLKSFVYDEDTQRLMAELDENNYATFYEYDLEGGLVRVKKETEKGVYTIQETRSNNSKSIR
jgi:hypothetical protein